MSLQRPKIPRVLAILADDKPDGKNARRCGTCTECCDAANVPEINKAAGVRCPHLIVGKGCGIYETRPASCAAFRCLWLDGAGSKAHRPDKLGVFLGIQDLRTAEPARGVPGALGAVLNGQKRVICAVEVHVGGARNAERELAEIDAVAPLHLIEYPKATRAYPKDARPREPSGAPTTPTTTEEP